MRRQLTLAVLALVSLGLPALAEPDEQLPLVLPQAEGTRCDLGPGTPLTATGLRDRLEHAIDLPPEPFRIDWRQPDFPIANPNQVCLNYEIASADLSKSGRLTLRLRFKAEGFRTGHLEARGRIVEQRNALVPLRTVKAGTSMSDALVERIVLDAGRVDGEVLSELDAIRGLIAAVRLPAGRPIAEHALEAPFNVHRGQPLKLRYRTKALTLERPATALVDARIGESIVVAVGDGATVEAQLTGDSIAEVRGTP